MFREISIGAVIRAGLPGAAPLAAALLLCAAGTAPAQERSRVTVDLVTLDAEISPVAQTLTAKAALRLTPLDDGVTSASFDLNNALNVSRVVDEKGTEVPAARDQQSSSIRLSFEPGLAKGRPVTVTFYYDGKLTGQEESPVYGVKFAAIHPDFAYLMYPARWFPVAGYSTGRFASDFRITVPDGYKVVASGLDSPPQSANGKTMVEFKFDHPTFPGSIAVVKGDPVKVPSEGSTTSIYFRGPEDEMAQAYGEETGKQMSWFTGTFGLPLSANLTLIETEDSAPNGYAAPGLVFLSPRGIGAKVNARVLANQISRQWWEEEVSGVTRNHLWLTNGLAAYSELLWVEHEDGKAALETALHDVMLEALTIDDVPIIQSARLDDYSPELWALTGSKGAAVCNMLRTVVGDAKFQQGLQIYAKNNLWKAVTTDDFRKAMESAAGQDLGWFFAQWVESSVAPEFKLDYTIFRVGTKGYRVMGKVQQDMDTFRMPVTMKIETETTPEQQTVEVEGTSSEFSVDTSGKPKNVIIDPDDHVLHYSPDIRVGVAIRRGEQYAQIGEYTEALKEYNKALDTNRLSSLAHYRKAEIYFIQATWQSAANEFHEVLNGDLDPKWTEVWAHINLGKIYDISGQRDRAVSEYNQAVRLKDDTQGAQEEAQKYIKNPYSKQQTAEKQ
jgi:aminopeptidase N